MAAAALGWRLCCIRRAPTCCIRQPFRVFSGREDGGDKCTVLRFAKLSEHASTPTRGSARAAGYDLYSAYDYMIDPQDKAIVKTDIQICVPSGCYGRVAPRSGLAAKHFIDVGEYV
ncbi:unnamed protein product [Ranitomeya imitator]|uniref:Deoxyuridine 5'-triphosphate nucleotidohydrolase n=1 Tax=Ranitomeya imitator TaxID=111125 RepID=A0ABN9MMQ3_9NEOB|nr:unnamed protein product [Ranitomeya imitator]